MTHWEIGAYTGAGPNLSGPISTDYRLCARRVGEGLWSRIKGRSSTAARQYIVDHGHPEWHSPLQIEEDYCLICSQPRPGEMSDMSSDGSGDVVCRYCRKAGDAR